MRIDVVMERLREEKRSEMPSAECQDPMTSKDLAEAVDAAHCGLPDALADVMRRHNQRLFRIARGILRNDAEAEDIVQDVFVKAFTHLDHLRGESSISAWFARVTANMAISRLRSLNKQAQLTTFSEAGDGLQLVESKAAMDVDQISPEQTAGIRDVRLLLEQEVDKLPDGFREVFILREVEQMSIAETADALSIPPETVKTRLHRAKLKLRDGLEPHVTAVSLRAFPFLGQRCERTTNAVLRRLSAERGLE
ncbi:MAG: RNA polymerase sigma factor [Hyphomicrobiaceae bacterium]